MLAANPPLPRSELCVTSNVAPGRPGGSVLHLINGEHFSGAERVQDLLALALPAFGYEVEFACVKPGRFLEKRRSKRCPLHDLRMANKWDLRSAWSATRLVRQRKFQAIHAHTPRTLLIGRLVAGQTKLPLVYHVHSPVGRDSTRIAANQINRWIETWAAMRADALVCVSNSLAGYMRQLGHPGDRIHVVVNGVASVDEIPRRALPVDNWTVGTTALFRPRKGLEVLLQALARLRKKQRPVQLLAVGPFESPAYEAAIRRLTHQLGIEQMVNWTGFQTDVNRFLGRMDLFVLPSLFGEGLPMAVLEAMACGIPVVAANVEGIPEAISDGVEGLVFEPGNAAELACQIESFVDHRRDWRRMRFAAVQRQREMFSAKSMASGVASIYDRLLAERRRSVRAMPRHGAI